MVRVVLDTNLLISYLLTQGPAISQVVAHWEQGDFVLLMSPPILAEIKEVAYRPRLRRHMAVDPQILLEVLERDAEPVAGTLNLTDVCRDPKDDKFIACAVEETRTTLLPAMPICWCWIRTKTFK